MTKFPFYDAPYKLLPKEIDSIRKRVTPYIGEVLRHRSGLLVLHCPACRSVNMAATDLSGTEAAPTTGLIHCGAGGCKKCGVWFRLIDGLAVLVPAPDPPKHPIPEELAEAGVKAAPELPGQ